MASTADATCAGRSVPSWRRNPRSHQDSTARFSAASSHPLPCSVDAGPGAPFRQADAGPSDSAASTVASPSRPALAATYPAMWVRGFTAESEVTNTTSPRVRPIIGGTSRWHGCPGPGQIDGELAGEPLRCGLHGDERIDVASV